MPYGPGTYGTKKGRPPKKKKNRRLQFVFSHKLHAIDSCLPPPLCPT